MKKNNTAICGMKVSVVPTPAMMPSTINERSGPAGMALWTSDAKCPTRKPMPSMIGVAHENTD